MRKYSSYILFLLITLFVAILSLNGFGPLENLQRSVNDFLCGITAPDSPRPNIVVVAIDWRAQDEFGQWPWNHDIIADLLAAIGGAEPKAIAVNLDLSEDAAQISAGYTSILAEQLSWINNAVLSYDIALATYRSGKISNPEYLFNNSVTVDNPLGLMEESSTLQVRKVFLPADRILNNKPFLGFNYTTLDEDRILRHQPLIMNYEGYYYPSLSLLAAAVYLGVTPSEIKVIEKQEIRLGSKRKIPINDRSEYFISFPKAQTFTTYSAAEVLGENFNFSRLKDKLVVVGVPDAVQQETFQTPVNSEMVELFIKAAVMENIINDNVLIPKNNQPLLNLLIILIIGAVFAFVLPQVSAVNRMIILAVGFIILVNVNYFLLSSFKIIPETVYIAFQLVLMMIASPFLDNGLIANIAAGKHEKERILPKIEIERKPHLQEPTHKTREIKSTALDPENQATAVLEPEEQYPE
ncbi:MAG: CHASE2 domain-containing protein, partial [Candidatus Zixiibacteriota bacterium]